MKLCFDTNIVLDIIARTASYPESYYACDIANLRRFDSYISASSVTDIAYALHRFGNSNSDVRETLRTVYELFDIFDVSESDCRIAADSPMSDFEDALLAVSAQRNDMDIIITRDKSGFKKAPLPAMTPKDFVDQFCPHDYVYDLIEIS